MKISEASKKAFSLYFEQVPQSESPCGSLVIFIRQMFEMLLGFVCHMSCTARLIVCMQLRCNPKAMSYSGLGGERRMPRTETWWRVGVCEWVGKKEAFQRLPFAVYVCVCECTFMCTHMWSRVHLCVGRRNPSSRFLSWASSCVPPAHNSQSRRRRVWPRQDPTHQRRLRRGASVSLPPQSSVCFNHSLNVTINPVHTHTHRRIFPHLSIQCVLVYLIWLGRSEPCICACQCGNVCVKSFGSFLNASLTKRSSGKCGFNAPSLLSSCFLSLSISQLHRLCFSVLSSLFPFNFIFLWFNLWKSFLLLLLAIPSRSNDSNLCCFLCILTICSLLESWHHHLHKKHCKLRMHIGLRFRM